MGVYYSASVVWGLHIPDSDEIDGDLPDAYELPEGFGYLEGGDFMSGDGVAYVVHPKGAASRTLDSCSDGFGVFSVDEVYDPGDDEYLELIKFAKRYNLDLNIGWFAVSSVG